MYRESNCCMELKGMKKETDAIYCEKYNLIIIRFHCTNTRTHMQYIEFSNEGFVKVGIVLFMHVSMCFGVFGNRSNIEVSFVTMVILNEGYANSTNDNDDSVKLKYRCLTTTTTILISKRSTEWWIYKMESTKKNIEKMLNTNYILFKFYCVRLAIHFFRILMKKKFILYFCFLWESTFLLSFTIDIYVFYYYDRL